MSGPRPIPTTSPVARADPRWSRERRKSFYPSAHHRRGYAWVRWSHARAAGQRVARTRRARTALASIASSFEQVPHLAARHLGDRQLGTLLDLASKQALQLDHSLGRSNTFHP